MFICTRHHWLRLNQWLLFRSVVAHLISFLLVNLMSYVLVCNQNVSMFSSGELNRCNNERCGKITLIVLDCAKLFGQRVSYQGPLSSTHALCNFIFKNKYHGLTSHHVLNFGPDFKCQNSGKETLTLVSMSSTA